MYWLFQAAIFRRPRKPNPAGVKRPPIDDVKTTFPADLIVIPYQHDISRPADNAVSILLGDGRGGFHLMPGLPLSLGDCRGPNSIAACDLTGDGTRAIVVACAESRTIRTYQRGADWKFTATTRSIAGGWGSVAIARLTDDRRSAIITANADAGSITIYFLD